MRTAESVTLTCWPASPRRPVRVNAQIALVDGDLVGDLFEERDDLQRGERRVAAGLRIERRDAHQTMHASFGCKEPEGMAPLDEKGCRADPSLSPVGRLGQLNGEVVALGPALVHAQQHLGPVAGVGAPGTRIDLAHGVVLIVLAAEQRHELDVCEPAFGCFDGLFDLGQQLGAVLFGRQLGERCGVVHVCVCPLPALDVVAYARQPGGDCTGTAGVIPQRRL